MFKAVVLGLISGYLVTAFLYSVFLDSLAVSSMSEIPTEQWKFIWWPFTRVALYNFTLTGSTGFAAYHVVRQCWKTLKALNQ